MKKTRPFKEEYTFEERLQESRDIIAKYPDRVPVVVERFSRADLPEMEKKKRLIFKKEDTNPTPQRNSAPCKLLYLVPRDMSVGQFIRILAIRLHLDPGKALFVFIKNTLPQTSGTMDSVYGSYKDDDGFLYMCYSSEKTFG